MRTCANCHGINAVDQAGRPAPTNAPLALRELLRFWRTNAPNAYSLTVSNGSGTGNYGAGVILDVTANPAAAGQIFDRWTGAPVADPAAQATTLIMPGTNALLLAQYKLLPSPLITATQVVSDTNLMLAAQAYPSAYWITQTSFDLTNWINLTTNSASTNGLLLLNLPISPSNSGQFYRLMSP